MSGRVLGRQLSSFQIIILGFLGLVLAGTALLMIPAATADGSGASLSDAFFTAGMLLAASGALVFVSRNGAFDGLSYAVVSLSWFFRNRQHESYADYKARKAERGKTPCLFLVIVGGGFLLIALILVILFLQKEGTLTTL